jgi:hypothetical protein
MEDLSTKELEVVIGGAPAAAAGGGGGGGGFLSALGNIAGIASQGAGAFSSIASGISSLRTSKHVDKRTLAEVDKLKAETQMIYAQIAQLQAGGGQQASRQA